jgi:hypothetical protein
MTIRSSNFKPHGLAAGGGMMGQTKNSALVTAILVCMIGWATDAFAEAHCYCKLSCYNQTGTSVGSVLKDYGILTTYSGPFQQSPANQNNCRQLCKAAASADVGAQALATAACAMGCPNGSIVKAYSAVGNKPYDSGAYLTIGTLVNTPAVTNTTYDCGGVPGTWLDPPTAGNGNHARCIKTSCAAVDGVPAAPPWVAIGTGWASATGPVWGTDGSGNIWYGVPAPSTTTEVSPAQCHW